MTARTTRMVPPIWAALAIVAMHLLNRWFPIAVLVPEPWNLAGIALILLGGSLAIPSAMSFKRAGTPVFPFAPSTALVITGWYRFTRNPMYLGMVIVLAGVAILAGSLGAWLPLPLFIAIIEWRFIRGEERFLEEIFGQQYRDYCARVRRWI
jgi:protein-S-isoprenylcysteine O-methyltransferase Ste14